MSDDFTIKNDDAGWKVKGQGHEAPEVEMAAPVAEAPPAGSEAVRPDAVCPSEIPHRDWLADHVPGAWLTKGGEIVDVAVDAATMTIKGCDHIYRFGSDGRCYFDLNHDLLAPMDVWLKHTGTTCPLPEYIDSVNLMIRWDDSVSEDGPYHIDCIFGWEASIEAYKIVRKQEAASVEPLTGEFVKQYVEEFKENIGPVMESKPQPTHQPFTDASWSKMQAYNGNMYSRSATEADFRALGLVLRTAEEWDEHTSPSPNLALADALKQAHEKERDLSDQIAYLQKQLAKQDDRISKISGDWWDVVRKLVALTAEK